MRKFVAVSSLALVAAGPPPSTDAKLRAIVAPVSAAQLRANVEKLVSFGTRHTLSSQTDPKRGIGAALEWGRSEFQRYSAACGNCLTIVDPSEVFTNDRIPKPTRVRDMMGPTARSDLSHLTDAEIAELHGYLAARAQALSK